MTWFYAAVGAGLWIVIAWMAVRGIVTGTLTPNHRPVRFGDHPIWFLVGLLLHVIAVIALAVLIWRSLAEASP